MKYLLLTVVLAMFPASLIAVNNHDDAIKNLLATCRYESNTPFVSSAGPSGAYYIGKSDGQYLIEVAVQLRYAAYFSDREFVKARAKLEEVREWIRQFYARYGLHLNIRFDHARFDRNSSNPHPLPARKSFVVYIRRDTGDHMKKSYWGVNSNQELDERARVIAHEFSHLLTLKDEYLSATGARSLLEELGYENDSLMKNVDHPNPKLYVRHLRQILEPLCEMPAEMRLAQETVGGLSYP